MRSAAAEPSTCTQQLCLHAQCRRRAGNKHAAPPWRLRCAASHPPSRCSRAQARLDAPEATSGCRAASKLTMQGTRACTPVGARCQCPLLRLSADAPPRRLWRGKSMGQRAAGRQKRSYSCAVTYTHLRRLRAGHQVPPRAQQAGGSKPQSNPHTGRQSRRQGAQVGQTPCCPAPRKTGSSCQGAYPRPCEVRWYRVADALG